MNLGESGGWCMKVLLLSALASMRAQSPGAGAQPTDSADTGDAHIDHVILGIGDLEQGVRAFATATGVTPQRGGEHPARGTANALVSLGAGCYLEILAPAGPGSGEQGKPRTPVAPGGGTDLGTLRTLTPVGWAIGTRDLDGLLARFARHGFELSGPVPGSRRRPDGLLLEWRTAHLGEPGIIPLAPFFIEWSAETPHPSTTSPPGCELAGIELGDPAPKKLDLLLRAAGVATRPKPARERRMALTLNCPRGRVIFDSRGR